MAFGKEIKRLREDAQISAEKLASKIGIDSARLRKWEQKDLTPRFDDIKRIEIFFKKPVEDIMKLKTIKEFLNVPRESLELTSEVGKIIGKHEERLLRIEACMEVYESAIAGLLSEKRTDFTKKVGELREAVRVAVNRRFDELDRRSKP